MKKIFIFFISILLMITSTYAFAKNSKDISNTQVKKKQSLTKKNMVLILLKTKMAIQ